MLRASIILLYFSPILHSPQRECRPSCEHTRTHTRKHEPARAGVHPHVCSFDFRDLINSRKAKRQTSGLRASEASELAVIPLICMFLMSAGKRAPCNFL